MLELKTTSELGLRNKFQKVTRWEKESPKKDLN